MSTPSFGGRVHAAVAAGASVEEVRRAIDACAPLGDEQGRAEAVNGKEQIYESGGAKGCEDTPLQAACDLRRGDLVSLLLGEGADASKVHGYADDLTALALCVCYDLPETLRALLRKGHDANQRFERNVKGVPTAPGAGCTLGHLCVDPRYLFASDAPCPPRLACLEALVRDGGASVGARDLFGKTPLHWAARGDEIDTAAVVDLLVRLGADVNARDKGENTPVFECVRIGGDAAMLRRLLLHGASPDVVNDKGYTPLLMVTQNGSVHTQDLTFELMRRSSPETRRAVVPRTNHYAGYSAIDFIVQAGGGTFVPWQKDLIAELLAYGASVQPRRTVAVLPIAVSHGLPLAARKEAELVALRPAERCTTSWRAHEGFARLAMDVGELRAAESEVAAKRRRVLKLEMELLALGGGSESNSSSGSGSDEGERRGGRERERGGRQRGRGGRGRERRRKRKRLRRM